MNECLQSLPSTGGTVDLIVLAAILLLAGIGAIRLARGRASRLMAVGLPLIAVLSFNVPEVPVDDGCERLSFEMPSFDIPRSTPTTAPESTTPTTDVACISAPTLADGGTPTVTEETPFAIVSDGSWTSPPGCTTTYSYTWQYTILEEPAEDQWTPYTGLTSNSVPLDDLFELAGGCSAWYARALVTTTNGPGLSTTVAAAPLVSFAC